ncbi:MAG: EAL domain-containing protein [Alphaproteobacteria bacterium]|nr:EAL domain-containing protein [Alphaproteobacteria bacterium]MCB9931603.1 EAL domain-containing protein [Alphaproteobacteria bacterium]
MREAMTPAPRPSGSRIGPTGAETGDDDTLRRLATAEAALAELRRDAALREAEVQRLTLADPLTGLPNHRDFTNRAQSALERAARQNGSVALLLIDLDGFREINLAHGSGAGDRVLSEVAARLRGVVRSTDTLARLAADEFALLLESLEDEAAAVHAAERVLQALADPIRIDGHAIACPASIGIATLARQDGRTPVGCIHRLRQHADIALHRAKAAGGGRYQFFDTALHREVEETKRIEAALQPALELGQFSMALQPRIDLRTGAACGAEALVRWHHPELGWIPPDRFIRIAEASGRVLPLCAWIMEEVFRIAARWRAISQTRSLPLLPIAMNLSAVQLQDDELRAALQRLVRTYAVPPSAIELEVTETAAIEEIGQTADRLAALRGDGYRVAIDDFGTGYASLALAVRLPADYLKIDRSFIAGMLTSRRHAAAVATTLALGRSLDLSVVAEGVETEAEAAYLRARGCDEAQGYLYARPMPFDALVDWLAARHCPASVPDTV